tara:strand:+ start:5818 stop:8112 length:2295 start_codon:yes stop_codon:yes gene_type:complete
MIKNIDPRAKKGMRIRMLSMADENPIDDDLEGTIDRIDDIGTLHVNWDDGRTLGVIPNVDDYELLPPSEEQVDFDVFENVASILSKAKKTQKQVSSKNISKSVDKMFKSETSKNKIKLESEGGKSEGMTIKDIAKKHKKPLGDIKKEINIGTKIEMEHTDSRAKAKEIAMDHVTEFHDFYSNKKYGAIASEKGLEKDLEETTTAGSAGAYNAPLFGKQTNKDIIKKPFAKNIADKVVGKKSISNPTGKIYSFKPNTSESTVFKKSELLNELSSTSSSKLRDAEGAFDGDSWVGKKGWVRKDELAWPGGKISDILAKMNIDWGDSDLTLTDKETDNINEGWLIKSKEDKLVLSILKRVKERYPDNVKLDSGYGGGKNDLPNWGNPILFTLPGIKREAKINVKCYDVPYQGGSTACSLKVNNKDLDASKWAIKKLYNFFFEKIHDETKLKLDREIESDLTDPGYAEDVFDMLDDEDVVSEGSIKKPHRRKDKEVLGEGIRTGNDIIDTLLGIFITSRLAGVKTKEIPQYLAELGPELILYFMKFLRRFGYTVDVDYIRDNWNNLLKKALGKYYKEGGIVEPLDEASNTYEPRKRKHNSDKEEDLEETTTFSSVFGGGYPVTPFMFAKKGKHNPSKKPIWKGGKIVQKFTKSNLLDEINKVKFVKGGKYVKIKDKCAKYNNQPWCSQGAIDDPLKFSNTVFENIKKVSKKIGMSEEKIMDKIKAKLKGVSKEQMDYNKENNLPLWWKGSKEGFYEKMEPRNNYTGSN